MTFDLTFDPTFGSVLLDDTPAPVAGCRERGVLLGWLTGQGWHYYLFSAFADYATTSNTFGTYEQGGAVRDTVKRFATVITARAGFIDRQTANVLRTLYDSAAVYALLPVEGDETKVETVPVRIDPGTVKYWQGLNNRMQFEASVQFPFTLTQRN